MIVNRLLLWATSRLVFLFALLGSALAADVRLATTQPDDTFISSLRSSRYLAEAGITIAVVKVPTDDDALNAVMKGSAELGLFEFGVFSNRKFEKQPELFSVFTRPFLFHSASELLDVQNTPVGDAVLADVRQVGIFPLSFWNRGLSQIWTRQPVNTAEHLRGLTVGENSDRPPNREREMIFTSLGVKSTKAPPQAMADAFSNGRLSGYVFENTDSQDSAWQHRSFGFTVYATEFQPRVGVFAGALGYWNELPEADKVALKQAVDEANRKSNGQLIASETSRRYQGVVFVSDERRALVTSVARSNQTTVRLSQDLQLIDEAKAFINSNSGNPNSPGVKKKRN